MAALAGAAVLVTLAVLLVPACARVRAALARAQGDRLVAIARSVAAQMPPEFAASLASRTRDSVAVPPAVRDLVRRARVENNDVLGAGNELLTLDIVARDPSSKFRYVLQSERMTSSGETWTPADLLDETVAVGQWGATSVYELEGDAVLAGAVPITTPPPAHKVVGAVVATGRAQALLADARRAVADLGLYATLAFIISVALAYWGATHLTKGMHQLSIQAERVARGQLKEELSFKSDDEVGQLASSFREMTTGLRSLVIELDTSAAEMASTAEELAS